MTNSQQRHKMHFKAFKPELHQRFFKDFGRGPLIHDFVAAFGVNDRRCVANYEFWGRPLDTGSRPSILDN